MAIYNISFMDNATNILELFVGVGTAVNDNYLIGNLMLSGFAIILYIFMVKNTDILENLVITSFLTSILAILLWSIGLILISTVLYPIVLLVFSLFLLFFGGG